MSAIELRAPINTGNGFCGPAVISAITGHGTAEIARLIRSFSNRSSVKGTWTWEVSKALRLLGYDTVQIKSWHEQGKYPTLAGWLKHSKAIRTAGVVYLVSAGHHWQLVSGRRYVCGRIKEVVSIRDERVKRRARVKGVWRITKIGKPTDEVLKLMAPAATTYDGDLQKAKRLAAKHGINVERESDYWWVHNPEGIGEEYDNDPYDDGHICWDGREVLEHVETYVRLLAEMKQAA